MSINVGVIGLGRIGKIHAENLVNRIPNVVVHTAVDPDLATAEFARELGIQNHSTNPDDVFSDSIQAVIICSPTPTHFPLIEKAAANGIHIFCEKPLEMTVEKIQAINEIVTRHNVKLQVGFNRRFDANFSRVRQQVAQGDIGDPHILKITSRDPAPPPVQYIKSSGGMFMDMTIHDFDMARFVVNSEVKEVFAKGAVLVDPEIGEQGDIDTAIITLTFANGCIGVIDNSREAVYGYDQRLEIFGSKGMSKITNNYADTAVLHNESGRHTGPALNFFLERYQQAYYEEMRAFIGAVLKDIPVPVSCEDALKATQIARAANQSLKENKPIML